MERKVFQRIGSARLLDIIVILDDTKEIYSGRVEDAPEYIKDLKYSSVKMGKAMTHYVYSDCNDISNLPL